MLKGISDFYNRSMILYRVQGTLTFDKHEINLSDDVNEFFLLICYKIDASDRYGRLHGYIYNSRPADVMKKIEGFLEEGKKLFIDMIRLNHRISFEQQIQDCTFKTSIDQPAKRARRDSTDTDEEGELTIDEGKTVSLPSLNTITPVSSKDTIGGDEIDDDQIDENEDDVSEDDISFSCDDDQFGFVLFSHLNRFARS